MPTTNQRTAMVQIPLHTWAIFCNGVVSGAVADMSEFTHSLLSPYFPETRANGAAEKAATANESERASRLTRKAGNAGNTKTEAVQSTRTRAPRSGSRREQLISLIRSNPEGIVRAQILDRMGLKGDKKGEMSVSNALTALTKNGTFLRNANKGYCPGPNIAAATQEQGELADA